MHRGGGWRLIQGFRLSVLYVNDLYPLYDLSRDVAICTRLPPKSLLYCYFMHVGFQNDDRTSSTKPARFVRISRRISRTEQVGIRLRSSVKYAANFSSCTEALNPLLMLESVFALRTISRRHEGINISLDL